MAFRIEREVLRKQYFKAGFLKQFSCVLLSRSKTPSEVTQCFGDLHISNLF